MLLGSFHINLIAVALLLTTTLHAAIEPHNQVQLGCKRYPGLSEDLEQELFKINCHISRTKSEMEENEKVQSKGNLQPI